MSNYALPSLPGLAFNAIKAPAFSTKVKRSVSGMEARAAFMAYPLWNFTLVYEVLRHGSINDLRQLMGFFLARQGQFDSFLFTDPDDNSVTDQAIGTGGGSVAAFQLARTFGYGSGATFTEPVQNVNAIANVKVAGVVKSTGTDYTVSSTGLVTFVTPPSTGQAVTWSGSFYYRCRFLQDESEFNKFMQDLWELKKLQFVGSPMNKVGP